MSETTICKVIFDRRTHQGAPRKFPRPANHWKLAREDDLSGWHIFSHGDAPGPVNRKFLALVAPRIEHVGKSVGKNVRLIIQFMKHPNHRSCSPVSPASQMEHAVLGSLATSMRGVLVRSVTFGAAAGADSAATFDQSPNLAVTQASWRTKMGMGQNLVPLVNTNLAGKWMFISIHFP